MIVTLTLNPAIDLSIIVPNLRLGEIHRVRGSTLDPAGKGINVSRVVDRLGVPTIAFGFLAGEIGSLTERTLDDEGVQNAFLKIPGQTRVNVTIVDQETGLSTGFLETGPSIPQSRLDDLRAEIQPWLTASKVLVLAGSLPPGAPSDIYAGYIEQARAYGVKTLLDTHGEPLRLGIAARPYLIKPNVGEAEKLLNRSLPDRSAVAKAAREFNDLGVEVAVISMGADGAVCSFGKRILHSIPPRIQAQSTVGSGDSMVAGFAVNIARGENMVEALRLGTAAGAATAMSPGSSLASKEEIQRLLPGVAIEDIS